jgi:hypothetical protein
MKFATTVPILLLAFASPALAQETQPATAPPAPAAPAAAPAAGNAGGQKKPATLDEARAEARLDAEKELAGLPCIEGKRIQDIVKLSFKDKQLKLETTLSPTEDWVAVRVPGVPGVSRARRQDRMEPGMDKPILYQFEYENRDFAGNEFVETRTSASFAAGKLAIVQMSETLGEDVYSVQLLQSEPQPPNDDGTPSDNPRVSLFVQQPGQPNVNLFGDNVVDLRRKYPAEVANFVDPMLRALHQEALLARVDPKLAWQVFADIYQPPADVAAKVKDVVKQLDAENFQQREAASKQLAELGQPAALILMRQPRAGLSDELLGRIDAFLAKFRTVSDAEAAHLRQDTGFLLDCLYSEDEPIRAKALAELRQLTGKPLAFDLSSDPEQRLAAIAKLREQLTPPTTTQATTGAAKS